MTRKLLVALVCIVPGLASAQIVISANATISTGNNPDVVIVTSSNITNNSNFDFSSSQLHLALEGSNQTLSGSLVPLRLRVDGGGIKTINGNITVTSALTLQNGILKPSPTGKLLYTGPQQGLTGGSESSYVEGPFFLTGSGPVTFPIGAQGVGYAPASIADAPGQLIGIEVINSTPALVPAISEVELSAIDNTHYWSVSADDLSSFNSVINLSLNSTPLLGADLSPVVVEADAPGGEAFNLGSLSASENSVTSLTPFTRKILAIGGSTTIDIKIHDLISPFTPDNMNDELYIENIGKFPTNTVTLLDRWGVPVKEWKNFTNYSDPVNPNAEVFNFTGLSPGNYICVVEYSSPTQGTRKKSQMVTVLKIK